MIVLPKRIVYPKTDIDGNPIRGDTFYRVLKQHEEIREGTKFVVYERMQKFCETKARGEDERK